MSVAQPLHPSRPDAKRDRCTLEHPLFHRLGDILFRPAETDGIPVMIIPLGRSKAAMTLKAVQAELKIENASPDGTMLALVAHSLDFVADMRLGDGLPVEVLDGAASWQPSAVHQQLAASRLRLQLLSELDDDCPGTGGFDWSKAEPQAVLAAAANPNMRLRLQGAYVEVAARLSLADATAAARLMEDAAHELGYVEALRDRLLRRVSRLMERVCLLVGGVTNNLSGLELVSRVRRLTGIAIDKIGLRFAALAAETAVVLDALRDLAPRRNVIRKHRDWLYSSLRGWEPILAAWEVSGVDWSDGTWPLLGRTYRFLAPRFMPVQEWQLTARGKLNDGGLGPQMVW